MASRRKARVTVMDVAKEAGVSFSAVSKVMRNAYGVSASLRERVLAAAGKLGYRPNLSARALRGQTYTIGVLVPDLHNPFFNDLMSGVNEALSRTQYQPLLGVTDSRPANAEALLHAMIDRQMDGIILISPSLPRDQLVAMAATVPMAMIGFHMPETTAFDTVNDDDALGAKLVVRHLAEAGFRDIAFFSLNVPLPVQGVIDARETGYRAAMSELGLSKYANVVHAPEDVRAIQLAATHLLQGRSRPRAIFCWTDFVALEVMSVARSFGMRIPEDVAIVGYDNTSACDLFQNSLTSIDQSGQVLGLQAARLLVERIAGRETCEHLVITPRLVVRGSSSKSRTAPVPERPG